VDAAGTGSRGQAVRILVNQASPGDVRPNRGPVVGRVLFGIGGLLGFTCIVLIGSALVSVTRRRLNQLDPPPRELARLKLRQAKVAAAAGRDAWRSETASGSPAS
jgi:hypothetical protein